MKNFFSPNEGFLAQLRIYRKLRYRITHESLASSIDYRNWCIESGNVPDCGRCWDSIFLALLRVTNEVNIGEIDRFFAFTK